MTQNTANSLHHVRKRKLLVRRLGRVDYEAALALQKECEHAVQSGEQPDTLLLLEHPHTLTIGRRGNTSGILMPAEVLAAEQDRAAHRGSHRRTDGLAMAATRLSS